MTTDPVAPAGRGILLDDRSGRLRDVTHCQDASNGCAVADHVSQGDPIRIRQKSLQPGRRNKANDLHLRGAVDTTQTPLQTTAMRGEQFQHVVLVAPPVGHGARTHLDDDGQE